MDTADVSRAGVATCTDGTVVRWNVERVTIERAGQVVTFEAAATALQVSRAELPGRPGALQRLLGLRAPSRPHLVVELRSGSRRCAFRAPASAADVDALPRLDNAGDHGLSLVDLQALRDSLETGGARIARGVAPRAAAPVPVTAADRGVALEYHGRRVWRSPVNLAVGLALFGGAVFRLAPAVPWTIVSLVAGFIVAVGVHVRLGASQRIAGNHRAEPASAATGTRVVTGLGALACWLVGLVEVVALHDALAGALIVSGFLPLWIGLVQLGQGRVQWARASLDAHGLHGWRPGTPHDQHIGWDERAWLCERAVNEGSARLDRTALIADVLALCDAPDADARRARLRQLAGESVEARRRRLLDAGDWMPWSPAPPRRMTTFLLVILMLGTIVLLPFVLASGLAPTDPRGLAFGVQILWLATLAAGTHTTEGYDRRAGLWLKLTRRSGSPHAGSGAPYLLGPRDSITATVVEGFTVEPEGDLEPPRYALRTVGPNPVGIDTYPDEAAAEARRRTLEDFARGARAADSGETP